LSATELDRRSGMDRRTTTFAAFWHGARNPRRRAGRRVTDHRVVIDWYSPRLLIPVFATLCLSALDAMLTVTLMKHGADELNPVMALFVPRNVLLFALVKIALTGGGLCVLVACSRVRLFSVIRGELIVYAVLGIYVWLIAYELRMLELVATSLT
jgi:uncharacterized membrane protein